MATAISGNGGSDIFYIQQSGKILPLGLQFSMLTLKNYK